MKNEKIKKIEKEIKGVIPQYRVAAKILAEGRIYTRTAPQNYAYRDLNAGRGAAYIWRNNELITICHDTTVHRMRQAIKAYPDFLAGKIDSNVWQNYITNGYSTRRGLYANYSQKNKERMSKIAESHIDIITDGERGHRQRVIMRNKK